VAELQALAKRLLDMRSLALLLVGILVIGCGSEAVPAATGTPVGPRANPPAATATADISTIAPESSSPAEVWWSSGGVSACGLPARYRVNSGPPMAIGDCADLMLDPASTLTLHVGDELDLHVTTSESDGSSDQEPIYPTPTTAATTVLSLVAVTDAGATVTYRAIALGNALLTTSGLCLHVPNDQETNGSCPVLLVTVSAG
jgi:hypothetical protein